MEMETAPDVGEAYLSRCCCSGPVPARRSNGHWTGSVSSSRAEFCSTSGVMSDFKMRCENHTAVNVEPC